MNELLPVINGMKLIALFPSYSYADYVAVARDLETDRYHVVTWWEGETSVSYTHLTLPTILRV